MNKAAELGPSTFDWWPDWRGQTCAIIACGPSAKDPQIDLLRNRVRVVVINESYQLAPWADVLYGCDGRWWGLRAFVASFTGLRLTFDANASVYGRPPIRKIEVAIDANHIMVEQPGKVGSGGNSGFQALNLAVQFGVRRILLIGYDMRVDLGQHWHGRHPPGLSNPSETDNLPRWRKALDGASTKLNELGVQVVNCSSISMLKAYPKMTIEQALNGQG